MIFIFIGWAALSLAISYFGKSPSRGFWSILVVSLLFSPLAGLLLLFNRSQSPVINTKNNIAEALIESGQYTKAIEALYEALLAESDNARTHYNLACCYSICGRPRVALYHLYRSFKSECTYHSKVLTDPSLDNVRKQDTFQVFAQRFLGNNPPLSTDKPSVS